MIHDWTPILRQLKARNALLAAFLRPKSLAEKEGTFASYFKRRLARVVDGGQVGAPETEHTGKQ